VRGEEKQLHLWSCFGNKYLAKKKKNSFTHEAVLETSIWQKKKKQLTTTRGAVVSYTKQTLV